MYRVFSWDTGEVERMSPWDLEPISDAGMLDKIYDFFLLFSLSLKAIN